MTDHAKMSTNSKEWAGDALTSRPVALSPKEAKMRSEFTLPISTTEPTPFIEYGADSGTDVLTFSPTEPNACPACRGSGRAWVHDAFGAYGTTCPGCDGSGTR
jgi:DnaJ-class molecular chaperone